MGRPDLVSRARALAALTLLAASAACGQLFPATTTVGAPRVVEVDLAGFLPGLDAAFVLLDGRDSVMRVHNPRRACTRFLPASTFKIPNTLIALETGVATGPAFPLAWDSVVAPPEPWWSGSWRHTQTLESAFRGSVYWYYQELARRTGARRMQRFVDRFGYGNRNIGGGIDRFWLRGDLRISPIEQVHFLRRFRERRLGASDASTRIVEALLVTSDTLGVRLSGKTGTADVTPTREMGWMVGYIERRGVVSYFALNMEGETVWEDWPPGRRAELVLQLSDALDSRTGRQASRMQASLPARTRRAAPHCAPRSGGL